ncbi:hypothetical protein ACJ70E_10420 [Pseudomonas plecoglossicida]|uniref:hypothetical protein n=1 Tax=Pseudomonas plecoglossicida TaxID=70775 RepID=UPI0039776906
MVVQQKNVGSALGQKLKPDDWPRDFDIRAEFAEQQELLDANYQYAGCASQLEESSDE